MTEKKKPELTEAEILKVKEKAAEMLGVCKKQNDIIGQQIFTILSRFARVIYYPLGKDDVWGFTRIKGSSKETQGDKPFVAINSSIPLDCQVFAAAHELYHIRYDEKMDVIPADIIDENVEDRNELKANRFAAEFLVEEDLLLKELRINSIEPAKIEIKDVLGLAFLFSVPFRTMARRLHEVKAISKADEARYLSLTDEEIAAARNRYAVPAPAADGRIAIDNLTDLAVKAYENQRITFEKLEYLLSLSKLSPLDVGIPIPARNSFPSDSELDAIMEE
ncbi:MAG: ImmA/IrrE family metallo-endopeptidase [Clostridia bacterium]|nr:ImmA/IrrE family metallo-endopeptidase [Clostridia bacterium]